MSIIGAINMLGLAKCQRAWILQASTGEVYGDLNVHPQPETYRGNVRPLGPRACYDEVKRCDGTLFFDYRDQHDLPIKIACIFNTYGPRMHPNDGRVVSNFIMQAIPDQPIILYGDGSRTRSFSFFDDLVEGLSRLMNTPHEIAGPVNLGNANAFTIRELAEKVVHLAGSRSTFATAAVPEDDSLGGSR